MKEGYCYVLRCLQFDLRRITGGICSRPKTYLTRKISRIECIVEYIFKVQIDTTWIFVTGECATIKSRIRATLKLWNHLRKTQ